MFLHLGGNTVVKTCDVIAILNVENGLPFGLHGARDKKQAPGTAKSLVITVASLYHSSISSGTLKKRAECKAFAGE